MRHIDKIIFNFAILVLAYAYAIYGENALSIFLGSIVSATSIYTYSMRSLWKEYPHIIATCFIELVILYSVGLHTLYPSLGYLCFCNAIFVWLTKETSFKVLDVIMPKLFLLVLSLIVVALILPLNVIRFFVSNLQNAFHQFVLIAIIFLPSFYAYFYKCKKEMHSTQFRMWLS